MNSKKLAHFWLGMLLTGCLTAAAADSTPAPGRRIALFDGKSLDAWQVLKCQVAVTNDCLLLQAGDGVVQTRKQYGDFILEWEWKALKADEWDSGVYFRYDSIPENKPWPDRYQANLRKGDEGNLVGVKDARSQGLFRAGEWNAFKLTVRGNTAAMEINGQPAWKTDALAGPKAGYICLQAEVPGGGQNLFRNVYVTELK
jgi:hypothetical protein